MPAIPVFGIDVSHQGATATVTLVGDLDVGTVPSLSAHLGTLGSRPDLDHVVVDLRLLKLLDVTGLRELLRSDARARSAGQSFSLVRGTGIVDRVLQLTGTDSRFTYFGEELTPA